MTNKDIFIKIISEVTNRSENEARILFNFIETQRTFSHDYLNQELSDEEANRLLSQFRSEKSGVLASLVRMLLVTELNPENARQKRS